MLLRFLAITAAIFVLILAPARPAAAQAQGYAVNRFEPAERGSDWFVNESLNFRGAARPAFGVVFDWAYKPLVLRNTNVITDQVFMHAGGALMFHDRLRVAFDVPIVLFQDGDATGAPSKAAVGDVRLGGDVRVLGKYGAPFEAAIGAQVSLPTGSRALFTSDGTLRATPHFLVAGNAEGFLYAAKLGFAYRPFDSSFEGRPLGSEVLFSIAGGVKANDQFSVGPEIYGSTVVTHDRAFRTRDTPLELLMGGHLTFLNHWRSGLAIGPSFTRGDGSPTMRVVFSIELVPDVCVDRDGDGICAKDDACPTIDGIRTNDPKTNGCPSDRDHDGLFDKDDACPDEPGVRTPDPKTTGCPPSKFAPNTAKFGIPEQVTFAPNNSDLVDATTALEAIARALRDHPDVRVRIEGHADDRESDDAKSLSVARAEAVMKWLIDHGIAEDRLRSDGYGSERLIDTSGTDEGRQKNRRVELHVIEEPPN